MHAPHHIIDSEARCIVGQRRAHIHYPPANLAALKVGEQELDQEEVPEVVRCHRELNAILCQSTLRL